MQVDSNKTAASIKTILIGGWVCLALSSSFFYISTRGYGGTTSAMGWLMVSRLAGIGAFLAGGIAIFNQRWTNGTLLFIGSIVLPFLSLFVHGTI